MDVIAVDELFTKLGDPGKFQMISYFFLVTNMIFALSNHLNVVFYAAKTPHHCKLNINQTVRDFVPVVTHDSKYGDQLDGCHVYIAVNSSEKEPCRNGWTYDLKHGEKTIISEFNLVCDDAYKNELATTIYFGGVMVGSLFYGFVADKYGRKPSLAAAQLLAGVFGFAIFIFRSYYAFVILRFFLGIQAQAFISLSLVLATELFQTKYRAKAGIFFGIMSVSGGIVLGILAYCIRDWKYIQLTISFFPFIQLLLLCFVPESLRWLIVHKQFDKVEKIVRRTVLFNNLPYPEQIMQKVKDTSSKYQTKAAQKATVLDLFKSPTLRQRTITLIIIWFTDSAVFYGLAFNISFLFGDKYVNFAISEAVDMCAVVLMFWAVPKYGRRRPLIIAFFTCGVANVISVITITVESDARGIKVLGTATALLGKSCAMAALNTLSTFTIELYPTVIRNISLGVNLFWTRIGGMLAPQIFLLGVYTSTYVPYCILGALSLTSAFLILLLPETHNKSLMDTIDHVKSEVVKMSDEDHESCSQMVEEEEPFFHEESSI